MRVWPGLLPLLLCLLGNVMALQAQEKSLPNKSAQETSQPADNGLLSSAIQGPLQPETLATRKNAVQARLEALAQSGLPQAELEAQRASLEQYGKLLLAVEEAWQNRTTYTTQLDALPQRLAALETERRAMADREPAPWPEITEALRDQYEAQRQAAQAEVESLNKQTATNEVRLVRLGEEMDRLLAERVQVDKDVLDARASAAKANEPGSTISDVMRLELRQQMLTAQLEARRAEREWLTKSAPLQDAMLAFARQKLRQLTQDLETITQALGRTLEKEQIDLRRQELHLQQFLDNLPDSHERLVAEIRLDTVIIRKATADPREQLNRLGDQVATQERQNAQLKQELDRLTALVEKYTDGELVSRRLLQTFERLGRERTRYNKSPVDNLRNQLRTYTEALFAVDDRLYEFDRTAERNVQELQAATTALSPEQRAAELLELRQALDAQKTALREQQQVLTAFVQALNRLLTLHREYRQLLDDSYYFVLRQMLWLRNGDILSWDIGATVLASALPTLERLATFIEAVPERLVTSLTEIRHFWFFAVMVLFVLPVIASRMYRLLTRQTETAFAEVRQRETPPGLHVALFLSLRSALWPAYLVLLAWLHGRLILPQSPGQTDLALALSSGLQITALLVWIIVTSRVLLQPEGWAQHFWHLSPALCRTIRRTIWAACLAALLLLVPRHIFLAAPGEAATASGSFALARCLFLAFQMVSLVLVGLVGRRNSALMTAILAHSRQGYGLLWRLWPILYVAYLGGILAIISLDILGYRYAAQFIWSRGFASLALIAAFRLLLWRLVAQSASAGMDYIWRVSTRPGDGEMEEEDNTAQRTRYTRLVVGGGHALLLAIAVGGVLTIWGVDVVQLFTSPFAGQVLSRLAILALTVTITAGVIQISRALTEYLLEPRATEQGTPQEVGRKLRTLVPLIQNIIKFGALFAMVLVILNQIGVDTGPIIAGVGIFGLAIGFASQSLIKDVINGLFILFEDSISVGDVVNLRGIGGVVEKITLRAVTIRDLSGHVHVIPNSSIDMVTNMTKDFAYYLSDVGIGYRESVDDVIALLREIAEGMRSDLAYRMAMLEPLEVMGLDRFDDSAVVIRVRLKTRPGQQWRVGREFNRRMKNTFDAYGIEIPFPHRTIYWGSLKDGKQVPLHLAIDRQTTRRNGQDKSQHEPEAVSREEREALRRDVLRHED